MKYIAYKQLYSILFIIVINTNLINDKSKYIITFIHSKLVFVLIVCNDLLNFKKKVNIWRSK